MAALLELVHRLRDVGVPVSMVEARDAIAGLTHLDLAKRDHVRSTLAATLVKRAEHRAAFREIFDASFVPSREWKGQPGPALMAARPGQPGDLAPGPTSDELLAAILGALRRNDPDALRTLAALAVGRFGGIDPDRTDSARYYLYRVLRRLDLSNLLQRAMREARSEADCSTAFDERLTRDELSHRVEALRRLIAAEIRSQLVQVRGRTAAAEMARSALIEDVDVLAASPAQLRAMRGAIRPLARKLAARIAHRRRLRGRGRLDIRRTIRRSLSAGGTPLDPAFRRPKVSKPDLVLLCDVSGSVAEFAGFTMAFMHAMNEEFSKIRSFVFVDGIDEVTAVFDDPGIRPDIPTLLAQADVAWNDGHSDYGRVFGGFWSRWGHGAIGPRATVVITGDARNNYRHEPGVKALQAIRQRARRLYWLNPEPRGRWNTTDSIMAQYAFHCDAVHEVRTLRQLAAFVDSLV